MQSINQSTNQFIACNKLPKVYASNTSQQSTGNMLDYGVRDLRIYTHCGIYSYHNGLFLSPSHRCGTAFHQPSEPHRLSSLVGDN